jgi:Spy/CpxP family protein refolding chaperone
MKTMTKLFFVLGLLALVGVAVGAQDEKKDKKGAKGGDPTAGFKKRLESLDLTSEQKEKIDKLFVEHGPKLKEANAKVFASLTAEQRKARNEAQQSAKAAGKKGKEANEDALAAMKLTDDQKKVFDEATKGQQEANQALTKAISEILTPEQREKAGFGGGKKKKNK